MSKSTVNHMLQRARARFNDAKGEAREQAMRELRLALELAKEVAGGGN